MKAPKPEWQTLPRGFKILVAFLGLLSLLSLGLAGYSAANLPPPGIQRSLSRLLQKTCPRHTIQVSSASPLKISGILDCSPDQQRQIQSALSKLCQIDPQRGDSLSLTRETLSERLYLSDLIVNALMLGFLPLAFLIDYLLFRCGFSQRNKRLVLLPLLSLCYFPMSLWLHVTDPTAEVEKKIMQKIGNPLVVVSVSRNNQTNTVIGLRAFDLASSEPGLRQAAETAGIDGARLGILPIVAPQISLVHALVLLLALLAPPALLLQKLIAYFSPAASNGDRLTLELGQNLRSISGLLTKRLSGKPTGTPTVEICYNPKLEPNSYSIQLGSLEVGHGQVYPNQLLAVGPEQQLEVVSGQLTRDPIYGMPGKWIAPEMQPACEANQCQIFDSATVVITHITEIRVVWQPQSTT